MDSVTDPESLRDHDGVEFSEQTVVVDDEEFETATEGAESQAGMVVVGVTNDDGEILLVDSEWVDGWVPPNGPVGTDEDWAAAADRWSEDQLGFPVAVGDPEFVVRTETQPESGDSSVVGYTVGFTASLLPMMEASDAVAGIGAGGVPPNAGPGGEPTAPDAGPSGGAGPGAPGGPTPGNGGQQQPEVEWFGEVPPGVAPSHEGNVRVFLDAADEV
jgi:ADP-ribose pyrophosphatase YjhB (NUDIX family)